MLIIIDRENYLKIKFKDRRNIIKFVNSNDVNCENHSFSNSYVNIYKTDSTFEYIDLPAYFGGEVYYAEHDDKFIIADDFFELANEIEILIKDEAEIEFFKIKGFCKPGMTCFKNIHRFINNSKYTIENGLFVRKDLLPESINPFDIEHDQDTYTLFKYTLNKSIDSMISEDNNGILLSGGIDSRLLLLLLKERTDNIEIVSGCVKPFFYENCSDVIHAERIANHLGLEVKTSIMNYYESDLDELDKYIKLMPFSAHSSLNFNAMLKTFSLDCNAIWSGQNMDTLYNLGPTLKASFDFHGIAQWFKRFYLTETYLSCLPDVNGKTNYFVALIAKLGAKAFSIKTGHNIRLPKTATELINNFTQSSDYTVFSNAALENGECCDSHMRYASSFDVKRELYKTKLNYIKGGDSQAIEVSAFLQNKRVFLPYSSSFMVDFFDHMHLTQKDLWFPKRYSYMYLQELSHKFGSSILDFRRIEKAEIVKRFGDCNDMYYTFEDIIKNSNFGKQLTQNIGLESRGYTGLMKFENSIKEYWIKRVFEVLSKDYGISIL